MKTFSTKPRMNVRKLSRGLYAVELESRGLGACLKDMVDHVRETSPIACTFEGEENLTLPGRSLSENLYRLAQGALNNALKHSFAKNITVSLRKEGARVILTVRDDGMGLPESVPHDSGLGLRTMRYRASAIGALFDAARHPEGGTFVSCSVLVA